MFTLKPESIPGTEAAMKIFSNIPKIIKANPRYKQFLALRGSSLRKIKNAMIPPMIPKKTGNKNHALLLCFSGYDIFFSFILQQLPFFVIE